MKSICTSILFMAIPALRWTARVAVILILLWSARYLKWVVPLLGCIIDGALPIGMKEVIIVAALTFYFSGLIWAWKSEITGGLSAIFSTVVLSLIFDALSVTQLIMMPIPALLFLTAHFLAWIGKEETWGEPRTKTTGTERFAVAIRWAARLWSIPYLFILLGIILEVVRQKQMPNPFIYGILIYCTGLIIGWKDEVLGGIVLTCCVAAFAILAGEGFSPAYLIILAPAFMFCISHFLAGLLRAEPMTPRHAGGC